MVDVHYKLIAIVNDEVVYSATFPDTAYLQESGLKDAEASVEEAIEDLRKETVLSE